MILFIGPPGCGKGTQSDLFKRTYNFAVFSFGDYLRDFIKKKHEISEEVISSMSQGKILPPDLIFKKIDKSIFQKKMILDGYPRTIKQAIYFNDFIIKHELKIDLIIEFKIKKEDLLFRILNRKVCRVCQKNKHICTCGSDQFIVREDDNNKIFKKRLINYNKNKKSIKNFYVKNQSNYVLLNASKTTEETFNLLKIIFKKNDLI